MTVIGARIGQDTACVWSDDWRGNLDSDSGGRRPKLLVNTLAGIVAVWTGWVNLRLAADQALREITDFDDAPAEIADALRTAAPKAMHRIPEQHRHQFGRQSYLIAGWSPRLDRMIAYTLSGADFFEPMPVVQFGSPYVETGCDDVLTIAARQTAKLRSAGGKVGRLSIANITIRGIHVSAPIEIPELSGPSTFVGDVEGGADSLAAPPKAQLKIVGGLAA